MDNEQERDTHFQGFADLLASEIDEVLHLLDNPYFVSSGMRNEVVTLIAQRAYDLVNHACTNITGSMINWYIEDRIHAIPDLTEWPKPQ